SPGPAKARNIPFTAGAAKCGVGVCGVYLRQPTFGRADKPEATSDVQKQRFYNYKHRVLKRQGANGKNLK
ncbi:MAG: hypothetical protein LBQ79_05040, partial [Deltaproteobacteria bacterium]|nr:hypothetical protein [Deltaproteobacteria bacterium]